MPEALDIPFGPSTGCHVPPLGKVAHWQATQARRGWVPRLDSRSHVLAGIGLFLFGAALTLLRNPLPFFYPVAGWEDATQGINLYVDPGAPVLHFYAGYIRVLPDLIGWVTMRILPLSLSPYGFAWFSLVFTSLVPPALFCCFRHVFGYGRRTACLCAAAVTCIPLGNWIMDSNSDYAIWHVAVVLLLTLFNPVPKGTVSTATYVVWRAAFLATNPLGLLAVPVWTGLAFAKRQDRRACATYTSLVLIGLTYAMLGIARDDARAAANWVDVAALAIRLAIGQSMLYLLPLATLRTWLLARPPVEIFVAIGLAALVTLPAVRVAARQDKLRAAGQSVFLVFVILGAATVCAAGRGSEKGALYLLDAARYQYVPKLFWCIAFAALVTDLWKRMERLAGETNTFGAGRLVISACTPLALIVLSIGGSGGYRWNTIPESRAVLSFLAAAQTRMDQGAPGPFVFRRVDGNGDWSIRIKNGFARPKEGKYVLF